MEEIPKNIRSIKNFSLDDCPGGNNGFLRVLLQLFGFSGHGKSSFINTCKYVLEDGEFQTYANVEQRDGGNTRARISYPLTDTLTLVDNRGCSFMNCYEKSEFLAQIGNLAPLDKPVKWSEEAKDLRTRIIKAEMDINSSDFLFPIFVYSVEHGVHPEEMEEIKELLKSVKILTGIFPIIVLTHMMDQNLGNVKTAFQNMGAERIFPLENLTPEDHSISWEKHKEVLKFVIDVIHDIQYQVGRYGDPGRETQKRKILVQNFLHESEKKTQNKHSEEQLSQASSSNAQKKRWCWLM